jgi:hypothetical protein
MVVDEATASSAGQRGRHRATLTSLVLRWIFLGAATLFAFHKSFRAVLDSTEAGSINGYLLLMPIAGLVAAVGIARREHTELPIHDRQTDVIFGILGLGLALMLQAILLQRYSLYFHLLRIDLVATWFFLAASCVVLFGLRPTVRFAGVWLLLLFGFPLGYELAVIAFGGNRTSAGVASLVIAAAATAVSVGRTPSRAAIGAIGSFLLGSLVLIAMAFIAPDLPLLAFQLIPASVAMIVVGIGLYGYARRGAPKRLLERRLEPLAARQIGAGIPLIAATAIGLAMVDLPTPAQRIVEVPGMTFGRPLAAPPGWHETGQKDFRWVRRVYGRDANLIRQEYTADTGNPKWDKQSRPRTLIVDSTSSWRPFSLVVYPVTVLYDESASRISDPLDIDLGHGVIASLVTVVDDRRFLTYNVLTWTWRTTGSAQRVMVASVDNHEPGIGFPEPNGGFAATLRTMFAVFFRGNQATRDAEPNFKDIDMLTRFATGLVAAQMPDVRSAA